MTVFPETAVLGDPTFSEDLEELVGQEVESFELGASAQPARSRPSTTPGRGHRRGRAWRRASRPATSSCPTPATSDVSPASSRMASCRFPVTVTARQVRPLGPGRDRGRDPRPAAGRRPGAPRGVRHGRPAGLAGLGRRHPDHRWPGRGHRRRRVRPAGRDRPAPSESLAVTVALGVDLGERRIGIAIADAGPLSVRPADDPAAGPGHRRRRGRDRRPLIDRHGVTELVIGLPLEAAGQEGTAGRPHPGLGRRVWRRSWADDVRIDLPGRAPDQPPRRGTPRPDAPRPLRRAADPASARRLPARVDREAAAIILHDALENQRMTIRSGGHPRDPRDPGPRTRDRTSRTPMRPDYADDYRADPYEPARRGRNGRRGGGGGGGIWGVVRFLAFALVLAAVVLGRRADGPATGRRTRRSWAGRRTTRRPSTCPFVADIVREDLGDGPDRAGLERCQPDHRSPSQDGDTASTIAARLEEEGLIQDRRAFVFIAHERELAGDLQQGEFLLRRNLTPDEMVTALLAPPEMPYVDIELRTGLRLEQITAKLQTIDGLEMDAAGVLRPGQGAAGRRSSPTTRGSTTALEDAPEGASLEGFLWPAAYRVLPDTTAEELVRLMLDGFSRRGRPERLAVPEERGLTFYQVLTLASIVEREAVLEEEKAAHRRRLPEPHRRAHRRQEQDPQRRPDGHLRRRHGEPRRASRSRTGSSTSFWTVPEAAHGGRRASRRSCRLQHLHPAGPAAGPDRHADPGLHRRRPGPGHQGQVHLLPGHPRRRRGARLRQDHRPSTTRTARSTATPDDRSSWPVPADFAAPPDAGDAGRAGPDADRAARPARLARLRDRFAGAGIDAYFGVRREHMRYLTGFTLADGEEKVAGTSGQFLVGGRRGRGPGRLALHDPGPARGAGGPARGGLRRPARALARARGVDRRATRRGRGRVRVPRHLAAARRGRAGRRARADRGLARGRPGASRSRPRSSASRAACAVADRALAGLLPEIRPGVTEARPGPRPRVADADRRRGGARLRRRLPEPGRRRPCRTARRATARSSTEPSCCSTSGRRSPAIAAT